MYMYSILYCIINIHIIIIYVGKPGGYDRVRNAEIGNKVRLNIVYANISVLL